MNTSDDKIDSSVKPDDVKSPERLEREADEVRARLGRTVDELSVRLSPGELLDQALGMVREHGGEFGRNLGNSVKQNPAALLLTAVGVSWMMMSSRQNASMDRWDDQDERVWQRSRATRIKEHAADAVDTAKHAIGSATDTVKDTASRVAGFKDSMTDELRSTSMTMRETAQNATYRARRLFDEQPLVAAGLGIALGAAIGTMLPSTPVEDQMMGRARDSAVARTKSMAREGTERLKEAAAEKLEPQQSPERPH